MPVRHRSDSVTPRLINALQGLGLSVARINPSGGRKNGLPDAIVGGFNRNLLVEFKAPGKDLSPEQAQWWREWRGEKPWLIVDETDCAMVAQYLRGK